jgi:hypothetical protein
MLAIYNTDNKNTELLKKTSYKIFRLNLTLKTMKLLRCSSVVLALLASSINAFTAPFVPSTTTQTTGRSTVLFSTTAAQTSAPLPLAPLTKWGDTIVDIRRAQQELKQRQLPDFAPELSATSLGLQGDTDAQLEYFQTHALELKQKLQTHGAIVFRYFDLMKEQAGFVSFYNALGMKVCLDPLHSVSARPTVDGTKNSPVYEAVNKESRKNFFIGTYLCMLVCLKSQSKRTFRNSLSNRFFLRRPFFSPPPRPYSIHHIHRHAQ